MNPRRKRDSGDPIRDNRLDRLFDEAHAETLRLDRLVRGLTGAGIAGLLIVSVRGLIGIAVPLPSSRSVPLVIALGAAIVLSLSLLAWSFRVGRRLELHRHGAYRLAFAQEVVELGHAAPREPHPYRAADESPANSLSVAENPLSSTKGSVPPRFKSLPLRQIVALAGLVGALLILGGLFTGGPQRSGQRWTFLEASTSPADLGFHASTPRGGPWAVESHEHATGARALVNREGEDEAPPAILVAQGVWTRDFRALTRCKTSATRVIQQCGLVFRFRDESNYSVARLDSVDKSVVLADVIAGDEHPIARAPAEATPNTWHELRLEARGGVIQVFWNSRQLVETVEVVPATAGRVGLWVPAAGVAYFDEFAVEGLMDSPRSLEVIPFLTRSRS